MHVGVADISNDIRTYFLHYFHELYALTYVIIKLI